MLNLLLVYLAGVTIFGKGPTYVGVEPLFWGEIVLALSVYWAFRRWHRVALRTVQARALTFLVFCFIVLGAAETSRDYPTWGFNALRDSAVWYYSLFYFVGLVIASSKESSIFASRWKLFWLFAVPWGMIDFLSNHRLSALTPVLPGSRGIPILSNSTSEIAQSIGLGCLLLVSDSRIGRRWLGATPRIFLSVAGLAVVASFSGRGARLAVLAAFAVLGAINLSQRSVGRSLRRKFSVMLLLLVAGFAVAVASGIDVMRAFNLDRFEEVSLDSFEGSAEWRSEWWRGLYDGVMTQSPAFGLGFGDDLNSYNPFITSEVEAPARAPHNYNMTIFSRMGIVGAAIWSGILLFGLMIPLWELMKASTPAAREMAKERSFWIAAIFACWVDASFGVLMEGPVVGIPFWLILGMISARPRVEHSRFVLQKRTEVELDSPSPLASR